MFYGPPGSGKTTQAELLADVTGLIYIDAGRLMEAIVHDPHRQGSAIIKRERRFFDGGKIMTPSFVAREIAKRIAHLHGNRAGVILSGNPRTLGEATHELPMLKKLYGAKNIHVFSLQVPEGEATRRNLRRKVCSVCGRPLLTEYLPDVPFRRCPLCAGPLYRRVLDTSAILKVRMQEYHERTQPIFRYLKDHGLDVHTIDGTKSPAAVFKRIHAYLLKNA
jgi:adenylate kinase